MDARCEDDKCKWVSRCADFRALVWWNYIVACAVTTAAGLFLTFVLYLHSVVVTEKRPGVLRRIALLLPIVALTKNPALSPVRTKLLLTVDAMWQTTLPWRGTRLLCTRILACRCIEI